MHRLLAQSKIQKIPRLYTATDPKPACTGWIDGDALLSPTNQRIDRAATEQ
jgi:hypothetical protein